jgi:serine kinase of HPr protein (carbohydrate metabolism regulator)
MNTGNRLYSLFVLSSFSILSPLFAFSEKESFEVTSVSEELRNQLKLSDFYQKRVEIGGFSVMGSKKVSDFALKEAAYLISKMTSYHPEYF